MKRNQTQKNINEKYKINITKEENSFNSLSSKNISQRIIHQSQEKINIIKARNKDKRYFMIKFMKQNMKNHFHKKDKVNLPSLKNADNWITENDSKYSLKIVEIK